MAKRKRQGGFGVFKGQIGAEDQPVGGPFKRGRETIAEKQARGAQGLGGVGGTSLGGTSFRAPTQTALGGQQGTGATLGAGGTSALGGGNDWQKAASSMGLKYGDYGGYSDAVSSATGPGEFGGEAIAGQMGGGGAPAGGVAGEAAGAMPPGGPAGGGPAGGVAGEARGAVGLPGGIAAPRGGGPSGGVAGEVSVPRQAGPGGGGGGGPVGGGGPAGGAGTEFSALPQLDGGPGPAGTQQGGAGGWGKYAFGDERGYQTSPMEDIAYYGGAATHRGPLVQPRDESILRAYSGGTGLLGLPTHVQADWDVNGDGKIDEIDRVPYPYTPMQENSLFRTGAGGHGEPNLGGRGHQRGRWGAGGYGLQEPGPGSTDPITSGLPIGMDELAEIREMGGMKNWLQQFWSDVAGAQGKTDEYGRQLFSDEDFGGVLGRGVRELEFGQHVVRSGAFSGRERMENQLLFGKIDEDYLEKYPNIAANTAWQSIKTNGPKIVELFASPEMDAVWEGMRTFGLTDANIAMFKNLDLAKHAGMLWNGNQAKDQLAKLDERKAGTSEFSQTRWGTSDDRQSGIMLEEPVHLKWREYTGTPIRMDWAYNVLYARAPEQLPIGTPRAYYVADMNKKDEFSNRIYLRGTSKMQALGDPMHPSGYETPPDATHMRQLVRPSYIDPSTGYPATEMVPITYGDDPRMDGNSWEDKSWSTQFIHIPQVQMPAMASGRAWGPHSQANKESLDWFDQWFRGIYGGGAPEIAGANAQPGGQQVQPGGFQAGVEGGGGAAGGGAARGGGAAAGTGGFAVGGGGGGGFTAPIGGGGGGGYTAPVGGGGGGGFNAPVVSGGGVAGGMNVGGGGAPRVMTSLGRQANGQRNPAFAQLAARAYA